MNAKVDAVLGKAKSWKEEMLALRAIVQDSGLTEELKWGWPCYTHAGANVVLIHAFKDYCALLFMKGVLLKDPKGLLIAQTENEQSRRQVRFRSLEEITKSKVAVKALLREAIAAEKTGLAVELKKTSEFAMPEEFHARLSQLPKLQKAFDALTPGRQRGYLLHFAAAKQARTREARVEKFIPHILAGKGLDDE